MGRSVPEIIHQVMEKIPEEHKYKFDNVICSLHFTAPEAMWLRMEDFTQRFNRLIPTPPVEDWHFEAISALTTIPVEELKERFC